MFGWPALILGMTKCACKLREWSFCHFFPVRVDFFGVGMWLIFTSFAMDGRLVFLTVYAKNDSIFFIIFQDVISCHNVTK